MWTFAWLMEDLAAEVQTLAWHMETLAVGMRTHAWCIETLIVVQTESVAHKLQCAPQ